MFPWSVDYKVGFLNGEDSHLRHKIVGENEQATGFEDAQNFLEHLASVGIVSAILPAKLF